MFFNKKFKITTLSFLLLLTCSVFAQNEEASNNILNAENFIEEELRLQKLNNLSIQIKDKNLEIIKLQKNNENKVDDPVFKERMDNEILQLTTLKKNFEQLAIGNVNTDIFSAKQDPKTWQEELTLVITPLLENIRSLTEKPRIQENLKQTIQKEEQKAVQSLKAIESINQLITNKPTKNELERLERVLQKWININESAEQQKQLALSQLKNLNGEKVHWFISLKTSLLSFFRERGLTLLIAISVSIIIWFISFFIKRFFEKRNKYSERTTYRIITYAQKLLTILFIVVSVVTVFFIRNDVLLLVISLAVLFFGALVLKNILPQFIAESKLLLNIGSVREKEQVIINGVPWKVSSINIFSKFQNPEIKGQLRLPISALKEMNSRPVLDEKWFPSSQGDWVLDGENLYEVMNQTPVTVELQSSQGTNKLVPTADYFSAGFVNLTKSKTIRVVSRFGVGYNLQNIALTEVPEVLSNAIQLELESCDLGTDEISARVEFEKAGDSSLDYIIIAVLGSSASKNYFLIRRKMQAACVRVCNENNWEIPFPQVTIHQG